MAAETTHQAHERPEPRYDWRLPTMVEETDENPAAPGVFADLVFDDLG